jgi:hypothetical protein
MMKKIIPHVLVILFSAVSIAAQDNQPKLIDEFGKTSLEDMMARVVHLGSETSKSPNLRALIRIYGGKEKSFAFPYVYGSLIKGYWQNTVKFPPEKLIIQFCNINNEPFWMKSYLVQENNNLETCEENLSAPNETTLFETSTFYDSKIKFTPIEEDYVEIDGWGEYSVYAQNILKRLLDYSSESKIYLVGYLGTNFFESFKPNNKGEYEKKENRNLDKPNKLMRAFQQVETELIKNGINKSRIIKINGGYRDSALEIEFWFVPDGGAIPKPKPDYVPKKKRNK